MAQHDKSRPIPMSTKSSSFTMDYQCCYERNEQNFCKNSNSSPNLSNCFRFAQPSPMEAFNLADPRVPIALPAPGDELRYRDDWGVNSRRSSCFNTAGCNDCSAPERILCANFASISL